MVIQQYVVANIQLFIVDNKKKQCFIYILQAPCELLAVSSSSQL